YDNVDKTQIRMPDQSQTRPPEPQMPAPSADRTVIRNPAPQTPPQSADRTVIRNPDATVIRQPAPGGGSPSQQGVDPTRMQTGQRHQTGQHHTGQQYQSGQHNTGQRHHTGQPHQTGQQHPTSPTSPSMQRTTPPQAGGGQPQSSVGNNKILKGRFLLEKVLGVGGMGVVYKAKDRLKIEAHDRDPYVAIKVLNEEFKSHPESFIALQRESRKSQRIAHPNTVKVYDFDRDGDTVFMTMEYLEGKPLDQLIRQYSMTGLPLDDAWLAINGMCSALIHAHEENIVHSDFKPGNVFITTTGMAKIFDFGIARAVANVDRNDGKAVDRTVFDAGSLGALTPAYASLEMLQGKTPDVRDDVYALGCVIYEVFTGRHPFNKLPADEAEKKKLKPKRIDIVSKRQWRAIEKSLAFRREDRIETVEELHKELTLKYKPSYVVTAAVAVIIALSSIIYIQSTDSGISENDIRNELEFKIRFDLYQQAIARLMDDPTFTIDWEENIWTEVKGVTDLLSEIEDEWLTETRSDIYKLYISKIKELMNKDQLKQAKILIDNAYRYTEDPKFLDQEKVRLAELIKKSESRRQNMLARQIEEKKVNKSKYDAFNVALENANSQLKCQARLNMRDFGIAINKLRSVDGARYKSMEPKLINSLAACITQVGTAFPERAMEAKKYAMRIFDSHSKIATINIVARDACDVSIAGLGASGSRTVCRDKLRGIGLGPAMVVIPAKGNIKPFAISKYEITFDELNLFCQRTKKCSVQSSGDKNFPVTNISISTAKKYMRWLSDKTAQKYRLPTDDEWVHAANSRRSSLDPNRNCKLRSRGIEKGNELVRVTTGRQNSWGLVNYVGNVQEWVYGNGRKLIAVGGSYKDSMDRCSTSLRRSHSGSPDNHTGFRVIREIRSRS
ncbi:MAG: protein kinase, partial [Gammaproteobacteria bacterium]|nr:protein kinase [Gammaproteobacteria bacterium]